MKGIFQILRQKNFIGIGAMCGMCVAVSVVAAGDTLYLHGGEQEQGVLKSITGDSVIFQGRDGEKTLPKEEVIRVQLQQPRIFDNIDNISRIEDTDLKDCIANQPGADQYPADGAVTLLHRQTYDLTTPGVIKETQRTITKILQQRGEKNGTRFIWFFENTDAARIDYALTITPDGRVLHLDDAAVKNESIYARFPQYRRLARCRFACKEPRAGNILDVQHTTERHRPDQLEPFYTEELFGDESPILRKEVIVIVPADREKNIKHAVRMGDVVESSREESNGIVKLTWRLKEPRPGIVSEPLMPPMHDIVPALTIAECGEWNDVVKLYGAALDKLPPLPDAAKAKAVELAKNGGAAAIYRYVARDIRTAPVPHPHYAPVPNPPGDAYECGFANELDKNYLMYAMLKAADIPSSFALVRGRLQGAIAEDVPSNRTFNRSAVYLPDEKTFASTGSDQIEFGALSGELYEAPALLIEQDTNGLTKTQPALDGLESDTTEFDASLDADGNLDMTLTYTASGDTATWMRALKYLNRQELHNYLQQVISNMHPAAVLKGFETSDLADLSTKAKLTMKCSIAGYASAAGEDLLLFHLPGVDYDAGDVGRTTRNYSLFFGHGVRALTNGVIHLPEGYNVYSVPEGVAADGPVVKYSAKLLDDGNRVLRFEDDFVLKVSEAAKEAYAEYKACKELRANLSRQRIVLMKE